MLIPWEILCEGSEHASALEERVIGVAAADPLIFDEVMRGVLHSNPCIKIQAAEMIEKITRVRPLFLTPYKRVLVKEIAEIQLVEVRQQVAVLYGRGVWDEWDMQQVVTLLGTWIENEENEHTIINALQSLAILAKQKEWIRPILCTKLQFAMNHTQLAVRDVALKLQG